MVDYDPNEWFESINLNGQWQPSVVQDTPDPSLDVQILNNVAFPDDPLLSASLPFDMFGSDDISNALIDEHNDSFDPFPVFNSPMYHYQSENDDMTNVRSPAPEERTRSFTLEETVESMHLTESRTDNARLSLSIQTGSSPVEPKAIDKFILSGSHVPQSTRSSKTVSKAKRTAGYHQASSTVAPINVLTRSTESPFYPNVQIQSDRVYSQQIYLDDAVELRKIEIICHPRKKFRPRTLNESIDVSHYLRCEDSSPIDYPTIHVQRIWSRQSCENFIEVTLVGVDHLPHNYTIQNKSGKNSYEADALIFRENQPHTLYFRVTPEDFNQSMKTFHIEYIKSKQDEVITKQLIKDRQLEQSKLRFTRIYRTEANTYQRDEISTEYSCVMTEAVPDVAVEHMGPLYGPMTGDKVYLLLKGRLLKDELIIEVTEDITGLHERLTYTKNCNTVHFSMPKFTQSQLDTVMAQITVYHKGEIIYQKPYSYHGSIDQALAGLNLGDEAASTEGNPSSSNYFDVVNSFAAAGASTVFNSAKKTATTAKRPKRLSNK